MRKTSASESHADDQRPRSIGVAAVDGISGRDDERELAVAWARSDDTQQLPGADLVAIGLADLERNRETPESMLVAMAAPRLRRVGIAVPSTSVEIPGHRLYELLAREHGRGAHSRYNALVARMVSYCRASERARSR